MISQLQGHQRTWLSSAVDADAPKSLVRTDTEELQLHSPNHSSNRKGIVNVLVALHFKSIVAAFKGIAQSMPIGLRGRNADRCRNLGDGLANSRTKETKAVVSDLD